MTKLQYRIRPDHRDFAICFICRASSLHAGVPRGYSPDKWEGRNTKWFCEDCGPATAKRVYHMQKLEFDAYERTSLDHALNESGVFLDGIGQTDLAQLTPEQFLDFGKTFLLSYMIKMRMLTEALCPLTPVSTKATR